MDSRSQKTEQAIVQAFLQLLETKEFDKIYVTDITKLAGVSRAAFYTHYTDKYDLLTQMNEQVIQALESTLFAEEPDVAWLMLAMRRLQTDTAFKQEFCRLHRINHVVNYAYFEKLETKAFKVFQRYFAELCTASKCFLLDEAARIFLSQTTYFAFALSIQGDAVTVLEPLQHILQQYFVLL